MVYSSAKPVVVVSNFSYLVQIFWITFRIGDELSHVKEIANTGLLVSAQHKSYISAGLEVFDVSEKGKVKKIYSSEEVFDSRIIY